MPSSPTIRLDLLGTVRVSEAGSSSEMPLLTGPRRLAVLIYLAIARPRGPHSRDTLIAMLWPEADQASGRHALRNALHAIRQSLGEQIIVTLGDAQVGVDASRLQCDVVEVEEALAAGRIDEALALYHGELLRGFFVSDAPEFERWLDGERRRIGEAVLKAAWRQVDELRVGGRSDEAIEAARRAHALSPDDEPSLRRLLELLGERGDRAGAARAYDEFAARLKEEYDAAPSAETQGLARSLRDEPSADAVRAAVHPAPPSRTHAMSSAIVPLAPHGTPARVAPRHTWWFAAGVVMTVLLFGTIALRRTRAPVGPTLVVLPMDNTTGNRALDYIAAGLPEDIARRLSGIGGLSVRSGARSEWPAATRHDYPEIGRKFGSTIILRAALIQIGDSLEVQPAVVDLASGTEQALRVRRFSVATIQNLESLLAADVAGAVFRVPLPQMPHLPARAIDPESFRLTLEGWHQHLTLGDARAAQQSFTQATDIDPSNARAWAGLSTTWAVLTNLQQVPFNDGMEMTEATAAKALALDTAQGTALINIAFLRAMKYRTVASASELVAKAKAVDPGNPEVFLVASSIYRHAWQWDEARDAIRIARKLDPITPAYLEREAVIEICAERTEDALKLYDRQLRLSEVDRTALEGRIRALALLGRYDEALTTWRKATNAQKEPERAQQLATATPDSAGYWSIRHAEAKRLPMKGAKGTKGTPTGLVQHKFATGDFAEGYAALEKLATTRDFSLYRLRCNPSYDEVRRMPRFKAIVEKVGSLPLK